MVLMDEVGNRCGLLVFCLACVRHIPYKESPEIPAGLALEHQLSSRFLRS